MYVVPKVILKYLKSTRQNTPKEMVVDISNIKKSMIVSVFNFSIREVYKVNENFCFRWKDLEKNLEICKSN